jgi:hypothetical protein
MDFPKIFLNGIPGRNISTGKKHPHGKKKNTERPNTKRFNAKKANYAKAKEMKAK